MSELEKVLKLVEQLELELVEEGKIEEGEYESRLIGEIKEMLYNVPSLGISCLNKNIKRINNKK
jgi:hypothetical protein